MNPPGCHRLHKTIGPHACMHVETCFHNCPRISVPDSAVGHQNKFLTNPPVTSTQCLIYNHSVHLQMCSDPSNSSLRHIYTQTQVWSSSSNSSLRHIYTVHTNLERGGLQNSSLRHIYTVHTNPERGGLQQQLTQAHIYTQTLSVGASSNSGKYIHTNPSVEQLQQQLHTNP